MQDPRIHFQSEGDKLILYFVSAGEAAMVDAGGENLIFLFSMTQENAFLEVFSKNFVFAPQIFFVQQKSR